MITIKLSSEEAQRLKVWLANVNAVTSKNLSVAKGEVRKYLKSDINLQIRLITDLTVGLDNIKV